MALELNVPQVGESITEVQIGRWLKNEGDSVAKDEPLVEIETDKVTVELPAPAEGTLTKITAKQGDTLAVGDKVGEMEEGAVGKAEARPASKEASEDVSPTQPEPPTTPSKGESETQPRVMPAAQREMSQRGVEAEQVTPTGPGGRILKEDVKQSGDRPTTERPAAAPTPEQPAAQAGADEEVVPMSPLRRKIAQHLVSAQQSAALLTTFNEADMSAIMALRKQHQESFVKRHGIKLGFMSFFVHAVCNGLKQVPQLNAEIRGTDIVYRNHYDVGVAVSTEKGLVVPVIRGADQMGFAEIEQKIGQLAQRARDNKLDLSDLQGGTFSITNGGIFGSLLSTPIVNAPQSGILGMHTIQERPVAIKGEVVIRPMMYLALTYDHRIVDGREAVTFLKHVKEAVEDPTRLLLDA